ncbi:magnesium transporter CorA family protein [Methyloligella sp. 2.7D]|uniref:magnesium transporter CorA family protein n=1 Tax=unclassified Methyloligella TaxID=2625955 RepID=UPI00157C1437|nr:magnesium transporter CorA family protein [Methyloligella sp. GL2]QKP76876.1 magnesium transporter CorA family protein [Methyloligella sp. GL2]
MLTIYEATEEGLLPQSGEPSMTDAAVWIDLLAPSAGEVLAVEQTLEIDIPTPEEQQEIEASSRLYKEGEAHVMTARVLFQADHPQPVTSHVTFILVGNRLVTLRYADPRAFQLCISRSRNSPEVLDSGMAVLVSLLEAIIDRSADAIERIQSDVDALSHSVFEVRGAATSKQRELDELLRSVGQRGDLTWKAGESVHSLGRLLTFLSYAANERKASKLMKTRIRTAARDVSSLADHVRFMSDKIVFLLDAVLGMITIEQNNITKIFTVAAVVFLPPTMIASIYGMNFEHIPELHWLFGYPFALGLMVLCALLSYIYWKRKGWL